MQCKESPRKSLFLSGASEAFDANAVIAGSLQHVPLERHNNASRGKTRMKERPPIGMTMSESQNRNRLTMANTRVVPASNWEYHDVRILFLGCVAVFFGTRKTKNENKIPMLAVRRKGLRKMGGQAGFYLPQQVQCVIPLAV